MKNNKKLIKFTLSTLSLLMTTCVIGGTLVSCSSAKKVENSDNNIVDNNKDYIKNLSIEGITNIQNGDALNLSSNIDWNTEPNSSEIKYHWEIILQNDESKTFDTKDISIPAIDTSYNNASVTLTISIGNNYSKSTKVTIFVQNNINNEISVINNEPYVNNVSNLVAKNLWDNNQKLKEIINENKYSIFKFKNINFDLNNSLEINNVVKDENESNNGKVSLYITVGNDIKNQKITCTGFQSTNFQELPIKNQDYFVLPGNNDLDLNNRITMPNTSNSEIIKKYGNAPLPWKNDNEITIDDLINMFNYLCLGQNSLTVNFGERQIDANDIADAFCQWHIKYRKYFPQKAFSNPVIKMFGITLDGTNSNSLTYSELNTDKYINQTKWNIYQILWENYESIYFPNEFRDGYIDFITNFFKYIQPNMTDNEKFILASNYVMNYLWYKAKGAGMAFLDYGGVCADYANLLSLCLSLVDVPSLPLPCGYQAALHEICWVYLDLHGDGNKKWYATDPTYADYDEVQHFTGVSAMALPNDTSNLDWMLFDVAVNQFTPIDSLIPGNKTPFQHDISNLLFGLPWSKLGKNELSIGKVSYGENSTYLNNNFSFLINNRFWDICKYSRTFYINGYTYYFARNFSNQNYGVDLYRTKLYTNYKPEKVSINLNQEYKQKFNFPSTDNSSTSYPPLVQQYGNKIILLLNPNISSDSNYQRSLLVINTNEEEILWETANEYNIPNTVVPNSKYIFNFDVDITGKVRFDCGDSFKKTNSSNYLTIENVDLGDGFNEYFKFNSKNYSRIGDAKVASQYFLGLIGMYRMGNNKDGFIPFEEKQNYYKLLNNYGTNAYDTILNFYNEYVRIVQNSIYDDGKIIPNKLLNDVYYKTQSAFDNYGFTISNLISIASPDDMFYNESILTYNIYYSKNKTNNYDTFTQFASNLRTPKFTKQDLLAHDINDPNGYYYVEMVRGNTTFKTNIFEIKIQNNDFVVNTRFNFYSDKQPTNINTKITNYNPRDIKWNQDLINFYFEIDYNTSLFLNDYEYDIKLQHINIDEPNKINTIYGNDFFNNYKNNSRISGRINLNQIPNFDNHGIYFIQVDVKEKSTNLISKYYSDFVFILNEYDYYSWDKLLWYNSIKFIFKNNE